MRTNLKKSSCLAALVFLFLGFLIRPLSAGAVYYIPDDYGTIQTAIDSAPDGSTIIVSAGTYYEKLMVLDENKTLYFKSEAGADSTIINGQGTQELLYVMNSYNGDYTKIFTFDGFTFTNGVGATNTSPIMISDTSPNFYNCKFTNNYSADKGGAISIYSLYYPGLTHPIFLNCLFQNNQSDSYGGAALINGSHQQATFKDCTFDGNTTRTTGSSNITQGGALNFTNAGGKIINCTFNNNSATYAGGAILFYTYFSEDSEDTLEIKGCTFTNNYCQANPLAAPLGAPTEGGALHIEDQVSCEITGCYFKNNWAQAGGGVNGYRAKIYIDNSVFEGNEATGTDWTGFGGAIGLNCQDAGDSDRREGELVVTSTTIRNSQAPTGGGIYVVGDIDASHWNRANVTLTDVTIDNCTAYNDNNSYGHGGAIALALANATCTRLYALNNTAESNGGVFIIVSDTILSVIDSYIIGNQAGSVGNVIDDPDGSTSSFTNTVQAYNNDGTTASTAVLKANPDITIGDSAWLTYFVAPYNNGNKPNISPGPGTLVDDGGFAAGTSEASGLSENETFSLTSQYSTKQVSVDYLPRGLEGIPFPGAPTELPGRLEAEDFDKGGEKEGYHDTDTTNHGGVSYRSGEGVDIFWDGSASNSYLVWPTVGEWLEYSVHVETGGCYQIEAAVASDSGGASFYIQVDGEDVTGSMDVPDTGGWTAWDEVSSPGVNLTAGHHVIRVMATDLDWGFTLDYLDIAERGNTSPVADTGGPYTTVQGVSRVLNAYSSYDPDEVCGDDITEYAWDLNNDGSYDRYGSYLSLSWRQIESEICGGSCTLKKSYTIKLLVTDDNGLTDTDQTTFTAVPPEFPSDFDGDEKSDLLWQHDSYGHIYIWLMNGINIANFGYVYTLSDTDWQMQGVGDFDGNGQADILWQHATSGTIYIWLMDGINIASFGYVYTFEDTNWQVKGVGDFDDDGKADILWQHATSGIIYIWLMNGTTVTNFGYVYTFEDTNWQVKGVGDFDADGKEDILWQHATSGQIYIWLMNGIAVANFGYVYTMSDTDWTIKGVGDFDGDGKGDILWHHASNGMIYIWLMNGNEISTFGYVFTLDDTGWQMKGTGDYNGDCKADILWQHNSYGHIYIWLMDGINLTNFGYVYTLEDTGWQIID